jgi:hypothetical protein
VRRERGWRERNNLPRVKRHLSPYDTTKGRRERYARKRAAELGISYDEALAGIRQRPADDALRAPQGGPGGRAVRKYLTSRVKLLDIASTDRPDDSTGRTATWAPIRARRHAPPPKHERS